MARTSHGRTISCVCLLGQDPSYHLSFGHELFFTRHPCRQNGNGTGIDGHHISAIARGEPAKKMPDPDELRWISRSEAECVCQGNVEEARAIANGGRHIKRRTGQRAVRPKTTSIDHFDLAAI